MARDYARIATSIWRNDDDFRAVSPAGKLVYLMLISQANLSACGLLDITEARWANSLGITREQLVKTLEHLHDRRFIILDREAEQLLIRTFVKWDGGVNNELRRKAITAATAAVTSSVIAEAVAETLAGYGIPTRLAIGPAMGPTMGLDLAVEPVDKRPSEALSEGLSDTRLVVVKERNQFSNPQPATRNPDPQPGSGSREPSPIDGPRPPDHCPKHPGGTDQPCVPCKRARLATEAWDTAQPARRRAAATRRQAAITACTQCDPEGWLLALDGQPAIPAIRCTHTTETP